MKAHACLECDRIHVSEAEEMAQRKRNTRLLRGLNALLVKGIERAPTAYGTEQMAAHLTGTLAYAVLFPEVFLGEVEAAAPSETQADDSPVPGHD